MLVKGDNIPDKFQQFSFPAIVKSQIAIGGRKKAGLIKIAKDYDQALQICTELFSRTVGKFAVEAILIEKIASIQHEYYCSIALNPSERQFYFIASAEGGIDIEEVSATHPELILKHPFSLLGGLSAADARQIGEKLGFSGPNLDTATDIFLKMWQTALKYEAELVEINPLAITTDGLIALDAKMILDDSAAYRQPKIKELLEKKATELEKIAEKQEFSFIELDGDIAILANGAGLSMALLDILTKMDLRPANFLDVGGGASEERVHEALLLLFRLHPRGILINIFGGITRCDVVAAATIKVLKEIANPPPIVIRLAGTKEVEATKMLKEAGINAFHDLIEAVNHLRSLLHSGEEMLYQEA